MASNKNQHFVPRCYLRPFASEANRKNINLYNIDRDIAILNAPIKSQCSRDYFYGKSQLLENAIQAVEGGYATALREILSYNKPISSSSRVVIPRFWLLQHSRTEAASQRTAQMSEEADKLIQHAQESFKLEIKQAVQIALRAYAENLDVLDDLKIVLAKNRSSIPFITSDDPAVLINRWHQGNPLLRGMGFGMQSAGLICALPLSPTVYCILYDGDVYSIAHSNNWFEIRSDSDVTSLNNLQYLNCAANLYFHDKEASGLFNGLRSFNHQNRPPCRHRIHYAIKSESNDDGVVYKVVDKEAIPDHSEALIHMETVRLSPATWPSFVRWRSKGTYCSNGSRSGHLRISHAVSRDLAPPYFKCRTGH